MKFEELIKTFSKRPFFEQKEVLALVQDRPKSVQNQLSNWTQSGKLTRLRRGKYLLNEPYRKRMPSVYYLANHLLRPSYVSLETALQYHDLIPEAVAQIQSLTSKHGRTWETDLGTFVYISIKQERFWGYKQYSVNNDPASQRSFLMARPEKSLVDLFYTRKGDWPAARLQEMRFQNLQKIDFDVLEEFASRMESPKVTKACRNFTSSLREARE